VADEFDGSALDSTKWSTKEPWHGSPGFANDSEAWLPAPSHADEPDRRRRCRLAQGSTDTVATSNGKVMTTGHADVPGQVQRVHPRRHRARLKLPTGKGLWPAFWLVGNGTGASGWPSTGEVDIFEYVNNASGVRGGCTRPSTGATS
jgi:hypothetical protein